MKRNALWIVLTGSVVVIVGVLLQAFSIAAFSRGAGQGALDMHSANSLTVHIGQILIVIGAIWAWWRQRVPIALALAFLVLSVGQLAALGDTEKAGGWVNGLHGLLALVVLVTAAAYLHVAMRHLGLGRRAPSA